MALTESEQTHRNSLEHDIRSGRRTLNDLNDDEIIAYALYETLVSVDSFTNNEEQRFIVYKSFALLYSTFKVFGGEFLRAKLVQIVDDPETDIILPPSLEGPKDWIIAMNASAHGDYTKMANLITRDANDTDINMRERLLQIAEAITQSF
jgi:hypothetical protein